MVFYSLFKGGKLAGLQLNTSMSWSPVPPSALQRLLLSQSSNVRRSSCMWCGSPPSCSCFALRVRQDENLSVSLTFSLFFFPISLSLYIHIHVYICIYIYNMYIKYNAGPRTVIHAVLMHGSINAQAFEKPKCWQPGCRCNGPQMKSFEVLRIAAGCFLKPEEPWRKVLSFGSQVCLPLPPLGLQGTMGQAGGGGLGREV